ncbi:ABC transporter permease [Aureimonas fodinaquatilis]|uniref:ABC transporter permease n=1 Tax=Aureimonas fodinaquatilis TaxID=2565783 RepID=A0A5B0DS08_9HYPH|nr:ABC transporter permease [Aureimonas fodinaquatilis]KAA0969587.1 ABC transporter permease [Aureimonas fodinaquatilis]
MTSQSAVTSAPDKTKPQAPRKRFTTTQIVDIGVQTSVIVVLCLAWQLGAKMGAINPFLLPALSDVLGRIWSDMMSGAVFVDLALTLYRTLSGFFIAAILGIPIGILMSRVAVFRWFFDPLISVGFPMPKIAFLPIFILWFDIYDTSKIIMVTFSCFFPIVAATYAGAVGQDKWPLWSARSFGATELQTLWEVRLPAAMPQILTGLQVALPVGMITTIVTEMLMGGRGIGGSMIMAGRFADSVGVFAGILEIVFLGFVVVRGLEAVRRRLLIWHPETRK